MIWLKYTWFCGAFPKSRWAISYTAFIRTVVPHVKTCHKIISLDVISHVFPNKFLQIYITSVSRKPALHIQNLSNRCRHKYDSSISQIFKNLFLAGFCNLVQLWFVPLSTVANFTKEIIRGSPDSKNQLFWEGHKNLKKSPTCFDVILPCFPEVTLSYQLVFICTAFHRGQLY